MRPRPRRAPRCSASTAVGRHAPGPAGPERPDERQAGHRRPLPRRDRSSSTPGRLVIEEQREVADDQRGIARREHRVRIGRHRHELGCDVEALGAEDPQQRDRRPRAGVGGDRPDLARAASWCRAPPTRPARREAIARPGTMPIGAGPRRYSIDGIMPRSIGVVVQQLARSATATSKRSANRSAAALEPVDQRPRVQIVDRAEPDVGDAGHQRDRSARRSAPSRSTGSSPAAGCCRGSLRAGCGACPADRRRAPRRRRRRRRRRSARPAPASVRRATSRPGSTAMFGTTQPRQRHQLHVVVAGGRLRRSTWSRGSGANARTPPTAVLQSRASARQSATPSSGGSCCTRQARHAERRRCATASTRPSRRPRSAIDRQPRRSLEARPRRERPRSVARARVGGQRLEVRQREAGARAPAGRAPRDRAHGRRPPPRAPAVRRRCGSRRRSRHAGGVAGDGASTWTSNTRTNVVRAPCIAGAARRRRATPTAIRCRESASDRPATVVACGIHRHGFHPARIRAQICVRPSRRLPRSSRCASATGA